LGKKVELISIELWKHRMEELKFLNQKLEFQVPDLQVLKNERKYEICFWRVGKLERTNLIKEHKQAFLICEKT